MLLIIGIIIALLGVASIFYGDKQLGVKGGLVLRIFSWPRGRAKSTKIFIGVALIFAGVMIIFSAIGTT